MRLLIFGAGVLGIWATLNKSLAARSALPLLCRAVLP